MVPHSSMSIHNSFCAFSFLLQVEYVLVILNHLDARGDESKVQRPLQHDQFRHVLDREDLLVQRLAVQRHD